MTASTFPRDSVEAAVMSAMHGHNGVGVGDGGSMAAITITRHSDRRKPSELVAFDENGNVILKCQCLTRGTPIPENPTCDPTLKYGDTPTGKYAPTMISFLPHAAPGIGQYWIGLDADDLYHTEARHAEILGRRGLGIIAGRGELLRPTHGSVRLRDSDMEALVQVIGKRRFSVTILDAGQAANFGFNLSSTRTREVEETELALAAHYRSGVKPHFWNDVVTRRYLIAAYGYETLDGARDHLIAANGEIARPSRSAISRFWQTIGKLRSA